MRYPQYLSPSALSCWQESQEEYYLRYLADNPPPRLSQTRPMSIGSAFDAYVKCYMFDVLFGTHTDPQFEFDNIFTSQVEEHNRDWALENGKYAFNCYKECGALADLMVELEAASGDPRFEFTVKGGIPTGEMYCLECHELHKKDYCEKCKTKSLQKTVPILGKPDVWYINRGGTPIILDFKVNGYCGNYTTSPKRGYIRIRGPGNNQDGEHKKAIVSTVGGVKINIAEFFEHIEKSWSQQLTTYAWLCGAEVGSFFVIAVDQLACAPDLLKGKPSIRVAEHRCQISPDFQEKVIKEYAELWEIIHSDHIFRLRSKEESQGRCDVLDMQYAAYADGDDFIKELTGRR